MITFIVVATLLLLYTTYNLYKQKSLRKDQEKELKTVLNRISDGVVSVDQNWRYTFLNDAAMATHPYSKEETLGMIIWDVHPEMKGTIFWDTYHEAMRTKKAQEIENYYPPMNIWFSVKVYPAANGLTIFYKDVTTSKLAEQKLSESLKETNDYKYALDESSIIAITDQKGIIQYANDNFCKISKYRREELIGQDHRIINSGYHSKEFIRDLWVTIAHGHIWRGELKNKAKDGTIYWVDTTIVPFLNATGKPYQYVAIRSDITERKKIEENLKKSLKETTDYKYALDESSIVAITNQKGIIQYANDNFCKISKYSHEELIGQDHRIVNSGYHSKEFIHDLWVTIAHGHIWRGELKNKAKDGTIYWVDTTIVPFLNAVGKPYQYVAIRSDITERKKIEENLKKSLKETTDYKYALDESSIVAITDQKGIIQYANDNFCKISKYRREELIGQDHRIVNSGYHSKEFIRELWVTIANGKIWRGELKNKAKDGTIYWVDTTIVPFLNDLGKPYQYVAIRSDITERKEIEENLKKSLQETTDYKYALDESSIVAITDQKGIIQYANDNFCKISKYSREELIGQDHRIVNSGYHSKEFIRELWVTIANGKIWRGDIKNKAKDGTTYWVETTIVPFLNAVNKPYQYVAIRADITQRKETEVRLSENIQELERSNQELEQFAYIASHDLQEPLRMVGSYMQLIERRYKGKLDKDADEFIHFAIDGATRMKQLIADLLNYSRMNKEGTITPVNMNDVLKEVMQNLSASIKENNGIVSVDNMPVIDVDRTQMVQLFQNLVSNALKFKREGIQPVIHVNAKQQNDKWLFSIADNGIGIEKQYSDKVFVVFKQLHTKAKYGGTGIGLAIAKKIVERHGGKIWFESAAGNGTTFYFTLNVKI